MPESTVISPDVRDEELCFHAAEGDSNAAEALVLRYNRLVRRCCRPLFLMGGDHEDLIQEGMLGLTLAMRSYNADRGASFHTYAERCIRNRLNSAVRSAASCKHEALNSALSLDDSDLPERSSYDCDPETQLISSDSLQERLEQLHLVLTALERQVLELYLEGLSYDEISKRLERSAKSVDNAVQRIRKKISLC